METKKESSEVVASPLPTDISILNTDISLIEDELSKEDIITVSSGDSSGIITVSGGDSPVEFSDEDIIAAIQEIDSTSIWDKPIEEYTPTEGLLLIILFVLLAFFFKQLIGGMLS